MRRWVMGLCLAYIMFRPVSHNAILVPVIGVLGIVSGITIIAERSRGSRYALLPVAGVLLSGLYGTAIGIGNPGLVNGVLVWLIAPVIFGTWMLSGDERFLRTVLQISVYMTIFVSAGLILYVAGAVGFIPQIFPSFVLQQTGAWFDSDAGGTTNITFYGLSTLVATAPLWVTASILPRHPLLPRKSLTIVAAVLAAGATLLAGRAAITVLVVIMPVAAWILWRIITRAAPRSRWRSWAPLGGAVAALAAGGLLALAGNTSIQRSLARVATVLTGQGQSLDDRIRHVEGEQLIHSWSQSPIFGHGLGAVIPGYSRSGARPWNFELQYHLILFQVGLVGALILVVALAFAICGFLRAAKSRPDLLPILLVSITGAISMLIANAINPYLQAPGNMWPVYFALMVVNVALAGKSLGGMQTSEAPAFRASQID